MRNDMPPFLMGELSGHAHPIAVAHRRIADGQREALSRSAAHEFRFTRHAWVRCGIDFLESVLTRIILGASILVAVCGLASVVVIALKFVGMATPGWMTTVIGVSLILMVSLAILSSVGLGLSLLAGSQTVPASSASYSSFIARISKFGLPGPSAARPLPIVERS
jgi:hypothetical protein